MKKLLLVLFVFISIISYAQLDREHWFAPMMDEVGNTNQFQSIYMSTNEIIPFNVDIYFNNAVVASISISKNNPVRYKIPNSQRDRIITTSSSDLFAPVSMGFYLKGVKPFFASLRFSITNHGEIQTSKGTAALGTEFRAVMAPITVNSEILNFMNSIMATENNTQVTISELGRSNFQRLYVPTECFGESGFITCNYGRRNSGFNRYSKCYRWKSPLPIRLRWQ